MFRLGPGAERQLVDQRPPPQVALDLPRQLLGLRERHEGRPRVGGVLSHDRRVRHNRRLAFSLPGEFALCGVDWWAQGASRVLRTFASSVQGGSTRGGAFFMVTRRALAGWRSPLSAL
ncbi:hypothetical protein [Nannocystis pusilla]|uniref:hypothetical protein n=1 Tax=Nannocystis pusilla TaxID=889268 RepID=UPI003DA6273E